MPDRFGFNLLGDTVSCIDCPSGGPIWRWPEEKRQQHALTHRAAPRGVAEPHRQRILRAAPPNQAHKKEARTMAKPPAAAKNASAKEVAIDVLRQAGEPLHTKEIAKRVIASGRCTGLKGKTPEQTITAILAIGSKPGGPFARVDKATYTLSEQQAPEEPPLAPTEAKPRKRR